MFWLNELEISFQDPTELSGKKIKEDMCFAVTF